MDRHDYSGIDAMTHGDQRQARQLRASLAVIARRTDDPALRQLVVQVLDGRESVRRVFAHPTFWQMAGTSLDHLEEGLQQLDDEQREDLMDRIGRERTDDEDIEAMREGGGPPGAPEPEQPPAPRRDPGRWG
jgi:hypothetical protein